MKRMVFGESVQGASHKRVDKECQDSFKKLEYDDGTVIMAIADGHGSKACPYSKIRVQHCSQCFLQGHG